MNKKNIILILFIILLLGMSFALGDNNDGSSSSPRDEWWMVGKDTGFTRSTNANGPVNISDTTVKTITLPSDVTGGAIVVGDSVFIHPYNYNSAKIYELNALNVSETLSSSTGSYSLDGRSLAYYNGFLYMHSNAYLYRINASNVSQLMEYGPIGDYGYYASPTVYDEKVYVGTGNSNPDLDMFNASNVSQVLSTFNSPSRIYESTPVLNGYAYGASSGSLYQLNASDLTQTINSVSCAANSVEDYFPVTENYVYKKCSSSLKQFNASDVTQEIASSTSGGGWWYALSSSYIYFGSGTTFYQLSAANISNQIATYTLGTSISAAPAVNGDYVYVPAGTTMYQLSASNVSNLVGTYATGGTINSPVAIAKGFIYFGSNDNKLYQLGTYNPLAGVTISSPISNKIYTSLTAINYSTEAELAAQYCWWSNDSGSWVSDPISAGTNFTGLTSIEGWNNWTVYCNNSENTVYNSDVGFAIDNTSPYFNSISNQTLSFGNGLSYTINGTDVINLSCYSVNETTNFSIDCDGVLTNQTALAVGLYHLNITLNDSVDNINSSLMWVNVTPVPSIGLDLLTPLGNLNVTQNNFFEVSVNVSCHSADCGVINVSLDPAKNSAPRSCSDVWGASCEGSDPGVGDYSYDSCSAGSYYSNGFWVDETTVNATSVAIGDVISITCTYDCYSTSSLNDLAIMYYNGTWNKIWRQDSSCTDGNYSVDVEISGDLGVQYARCSIGYNNYPNDAVDDTCFDTTYSDNDDVNFTVIEATKSGLISTTEGDTPFYTNVTNPYNLTLTVGQSQVVTWWVNATGDTDDVHSFFVYVNKTLDQSINNISSKWNVTIRDLVAPVVNITGPLNITYDVSIDSLNYTYSDYNGGGYCWYSKNSGVTNSSTVSAGTNFTSVNSGGGIHNWSVYCNDSSGNIGMKSVVFTSNIPVINLTWVSPTNHVNVTQNQFFQVQAKITCSNNDCGGVNVSLDPILGTGTNYTAYNSSEALGDTYEWEEIIGDGGVALWATGQTADDSYKTATLDIDFPFYDANYSTAYVSSNGRIHFTTTSAGSTSLTLPSSSYKLISPVNNDMYVVSATQVYYKNATNPDRAIIQYTDLAHYSYRTTFLTYQVILYDDGKIKIQYHPDSASYYASSRDIGLNYDASNYLFLDRDAPDTYDEMAVTFLPPGYSTGKSGLVSTTVGATPFYTNGTNPYNLTLNEDESTTLTWWVNATGTINESYEFFVYANKTANQGISDITSKLNVTILLNGSYVSAVTAPGPVITFISPTNGSYFSNIGLDINYSVTGDNLGSCWYSNDTMSINISLGSGGNCINITNVIWTEGKHNLTIWANDTDGNNGSSSVTFTIDTINPVVNIIEPSENDYLNYNTSIKLNYSVLTNDASSCWYSVNGGSNQTIAGCNNLSLNLSEGNRFVKLWVNDSANLLASDSVNFTIDLTKPSINLIRPANSVINLTKNWIDFYYNVSDTNDILNCSLILGNEVNKSVVNPEEAQEQNLTVFLNNGAYAWSVNCTDQANNRNSSESRTINLNYTVQIENNGFDGESTVLPDIMNASELRNVTDLIFENSLFGKINFLENIDLSGDVENLIINFSKHVTLSQNRIEVNSTALSSLDVSARLKFYNLNYTNPQVLKDNIICSTCVEETYTNQTLTFTVEGFSIYSTRETPVSSSSAESSSSGGSGSIPAGELLECEEDIECDEGYTCYENECVKLFDVELLEIQSLIEELGFNLTYLIKGMAEIEGDVIIKFWIENENGQIMLGQDTIYVGSFEEKVKTTFLNLPSDLETGSYDLYVQVNFENYEAESFRKINVDLKEEVKFAPEFEEEIEEIKELPENKTSLSWLLGLVIVLVLAILLIPIKRKRKKIRKKKKKIVKEKKDKKIVDLTEKKEQSKYIYLDAIVGKQVYSEDGMKIGKVEEVVLKNSEVYGWVVKLDEKYELNKRILIKKKNVQVINNIIIVDKEVREYLETLMEEVKFTGDF
jgi:sporulation protein YlmC with PRC-barrel domain